jgi:glycosyltransferase A (GT-A) superfamily protein (DUF2064 family)
VADATRFARQTGAALLARVAFDRRWETTLAVTGDDLTNGRFWPANIRRRTQGRGHLGQRMQRVMEEMPPGPVVIIGTDIPTVSAAHVAEAFRVLGRCDAVFGPARDGGYWLVGLRRRPRLPCPFANVRWSSAQALADSLANLVGRSIAFLPVLADVDEAQDLAASPGSGRRVPPPT